MSQLKEIIEGVEYLCFTNEHGPALQVKDVDSGEVVTTLQYRDEQKAQDAYGTATAAAWQCAAN